MIWKTKNKTYLSDDFPLIMGIINLTEDSFYSASRVSNENRLLSIVEDMIDNGVDIIDMGAESTRPGAKKIDVPLEKERLIPALKSVKKRFPKIVVSIDTYHAETARAGIGEGGDIINDISLGTMDKGLFHEVSRLDCGFVLTHIQGVPGNMQNSPKYENVVKDVKRELKVNCRRLLDLGMERERIVIDPGIGFGKTVEHNIQLINNIQTLKELGYPVLIGLSRKSFIGKILGNEPDARLNGTTVAHTVSLLKGGDILRAHDVKETHEVIKMVKEFKKN